MVIAFIFFTSVRRGIGGSPALRAPARYALTQRVFLLPARFLAGIDLLAKSVPSGWGLGIRDWGIGNYGKTIKF
jgi:hypothetical protein